MTERHRQQQRASRLGDAASNSPHLRALHNHTNVPDSQKAYGKLNIPAPIAQFPRLNTLSQAVALPSTPTAIPPITSPSQPDRYRVYAQNTCVRSYNRSRRTSLLQLNTFKQRPQHSKKTGKQDCFSSIHGPLCTRALCYTCGRAHRGRVASP